MSFLSFLMPSPAFAAGDEEKKLYDVGMEHVRNGELGDALNCFERLRKFMPGNAKIKAICDRIAEKLAASSPAGGSTDERKIEELYNEGNSFIALDMHAEALDCFERALAAGGSSAVLWLRRGNALAGLLRYDEALVSFDRAIRANPHFADAWYNKAACLSRMKRLDEALECFNRVVDIDPAHAPDGKK